MSGQIPNLFMMPWFPRDFLSSTRGWPLIARAIYRELLDSQWEQGGLPKDAAELRVLVGATAAEWRAGWARVAPKFPVGTDGLRRNHRLEQHRQKAIEISRKRAQSGQRGGNASAASRQAIAQPIAKQMVKPGSTINTTQDSKRLSKEEKYESREDLESKTLSSADADELGKAVRP